MVTLKDKDLGLNEPYLKTPKDHKIRLVVQKIFRFYTLICNYFFRFVP